MHPNKTRLYIIRIILWYTTWYTMVVNYIHNCIHYGYFFRRFLKSVLRADTIDIILKKHTALYDIIFELWLFKSEDATTTIIIHNIYYTWRLNRPDISITNKQSKLTSGFPWSTLDHPRPSLPLFTPRFLPRPCNNNTCHEHNIYLFIYIHEVISSRFYKNGRGI